MGSMPSTYRQEIAGHVDARPSASSADPPSGPAPRPAVAGLMFDTADVLYDATLWRRWLVRLVARMGVAAGNADFFAPWDRRYLADVHCGRREYGEAFQSFLLAAGLTWAQVDEIEAASRVERQNLDLGVRPFSGVVRTIQRLHASGLPLVAWADSPYPAAKLAERIERLGLGGPFLAVLSSFDLEAAQPAPKCYQASLAVLGLPAENVLYVGHDAAHLAAARALGMRTAAFNYHPQAAADHFLARFEDLLAVVDALNAGGDDAAAPARAGACPQPAQGWHPA